MVARVMSQLRAAVHSGVQIKGVPFFRRLSSGCAISANLRIKAQ